MPNMYARGILFGKMVLELGEICTVKNDKTGFSCDVDFKTKGFFTGSYNVIAGKVKKGNVDMGDLSGKWSSAVEFKPRASLRDTTGYALFLPVIYQGGERRVLFDAQKEGQNIAPKSVPPEEEQEPNESRRLVSSTPRMETQYVTHWNWYI